LTEEFPGIVAGLPSSSQEEEKNPVFSLQITVGSSSETIVSTMQPEPHWTVLYQVKI
jgi:hypothetical protein